MLETNHIYCGDSKQLLNNIEDNSIDLVVIDPPYKIRPKINDLIKEESNRKYI